MIVAATTNGVVDTEEEAEVTVEEEHLINPQLNVMAVISWDTFDMNVPLMPSMQNTRK